MIQWISAHRGVEGRRRHRLLEHRRQPQRLRREANRGNGQWWLLNAYGQMTRPHGGGDPAVRRTRATPCRASPRSTRTSSRPGDLRRCRRATQPLALRRTSPASVFGRPCTRSVREIPLERPGRRLPRARRHRGGRRPARRAARSTSASAALPAAERRLGVRGRSSPPAATPTSPARRRRRWAAAYEAEDAAHTGPATSRTAPRARPPNVGEVLHVGRLQRRRPAHRLGRRCSTSRVTVPQDGAYDLERVRQLAQHVRAGAGAGPDQHVPQRRRRGRAGDVPAARVQVGGLGPHRHHGRPDRRDAHASASPRRASTATGATKGDAIIDKIDLSPAEPRRPARRSTRPSTPELHGAQPTTTPTVHPGRVRSSSMRTPRRRSGCTPPTTLRPRSTCRPSAAARHRWRSTACT